ncbi:MAG: molecular chaperone TorD family protein [Actinomycetia bacterium]|nr:molecular chaperone TorD family protein [Actinomycetes bacterium]
MAGRADTDATEPSGAEPAGAIEPDGATGREISAAAASLLARWWTRPVLAEVESWIGMADLEAEVARQVSGSSAAETPALPYRMDDVPELLDEFERLFVGPGPVPCPPYESYWREDVPIDLWHSLMGPCVGDLLRLYRDLGIEFDPAAGELPDHVAVEFEALLVALSIADGDDAGAVRAEVGERVAKALLVEHLNVWLPRLCRAVIKESRHPFYTELAARSLIWLGQIQDAVDAHEAASDRLVAPFAR